MSLSREEAFARLRRMCGMGPESKFDKLRKGEVIILAMEPKYRFVITERTPECEGLIKITCGKEMEFYTSLVNKGYDSGHYVDLSQILIVNHLTVEERQWLEEQLNKQ